MKSCLVHGCYDELTLRNILSFGKTEVAFDLRPRSSQLVPFKNLKSLLSLVQSGSAVLIFENDLPITVHSFLDLLKDAPLKLILEFRDNLPLSFYSSIKNDFYWMFHPDHNWKDILLLPNAKAVLLPLKYQHHYHSLPELWNIIEARNLKVFLHAETLAEASQLMLNDEVEVSVDLGSEVEVHFRQVDQEKLKKSPFWRNVHAHSSR